MMSAIAYKLKIKLLSDTTFGRDDGVAGLFDREVERDPYGFPYLRGRTLKGLLSEECDNLVAVLPENSRQHWQEVACKLFGTPGSTFATKSSMQLGDACLPEDLRLAVAFQLQQDKTLKPADILDSLTTIRRQTAIDPASGAPAENSLHSSHVILRDLCFTAPLSFDKPTEAMLILLCAGTLALRRVGSGRNRGRGKVECTLCNAVGKEIVEKYAPRFGEIREARV